MRRTKAEIIYENTVPAEFVRRINRFTAEVMIDGQKEIAHVKNTGRLGELLLPKAKVTLQKAEDPEFRQALAEAAKAGVQVNYVSCHIEADKIKITGIVGDSGRYTEAGIGSISTNKLIGGIFLEYTQ